MSVVGTSACEKAPAGRVSRTCIFRTLPSVMLTAYEPATGTLPAIMSEPFTRLSFHFAVNEALVIAAEAVVTTTVTSLAEVLPEPSLRSRAPDVAAGLGVDVCGAGARGGASVAEGPGGCANGRPLVGRRRCERDRSPYERTGLCRRRKRRRGRVPAKRAHGARVRVVDRAVDCREVAATIPADRGIDHERVCKRGGLRIRPDAVRGAHPRESFIAADVVVLPCDRQAAVVSDRCDRDAGAGRIRFLDRAPSVRCCGSRPDLETGGACRFWIHTSPAAPDGATGTLGTLASAFTAAELRSPDSVQVPNGERSAVRRINAGAADW